MGIRFSKQIKIGSLVKLNISKSGVGVTVGKKGASISLSKNGTYLNLSPTAVGIKGTGVSYRQKITGGYGSILKKATDKVVNKKEEKFKEVEQVNETVAIDTSIIEDYEKNLEANINIHKYADDVISKVDFDNKLDTVSDTAKEIYGLLIKGDEETIESSIGAFLNNLDLNYPVSADFELEDHILYVDLDLPEIESFDFEIPTISKNEIVYKKKTATALKEEYGKTVLSLGIYLVASFFNVSSYIDEVVISGFTTKRNNDGDLADEYLYSIKYTRNEFEGLDLATIDNAYKFILKFENRINISNAYSFKAIKPYEMASVSKANSLIDDAIAGLKELGYKASDIDNILPTLSEMKFENAGDYVKEGLKLLAKK